MLKTKHIFPFARMIKKMGIKNGLKEMLGNMKNSDNNSGSTGLDVVMLIVENIGDAEQEFYSFISSVNDLSVDEIKDLEIKELIKILKSIWEDVNFASFSKLLSYRDGAIAG